MGAQQADERGRTAEEDGTGVAAEPAAAASDMQLLPCRRASSGARSPGLFRPGGGEQLFVLLREASWFVFPLLSRAVGARGFLLRFAVGDVGFLGLVPIACEDLWEAVGLVVLGVAAVVGRFGVPGVFGRVVGWVDYSQVVYHSSWAAH